MKGRLFLTIPLMNELENLDSLLEDLDKQTCKDFVAIFCVNQPDAWWDEPQKMKICQNNQKALVRLGQENRLELNIIDRSSPGKGWTGKHFGVGWARKTAMDMASAMATPDDTIVTMDGDTHYPPEYLQQIAKDFFGNSQIKALTAQYYHKLTGIAAEDHAMLRYEIYMRYFAINMLRIRNPYAFTAIGSAMACTVKAYRTISGITPHKSGEDFYFIQKLKKYGDVKIYTNAMAYPAARFSDRVFFGTGPAMIKGNSGDWSGYPIYHFRLFDQVKKTFDHFPNLYQGDLELPMSGFLQEKFGSAIWKDLRRNAKSAESFARACWHKVDGLRILQFLKSKHQETESRDEQNLKAFFKEFYPDEILTTELKKSDWSFKSSSIEHLDEIRNFLFEKEKIWRKQVNILR